MHLNHHFLLIFFQKLPCLSSEIQSYPLFVINQNVFPMLIIAMALCTIISTEALIFCILAKKALKQYGSLSQNTVKLQNKFLRAMILQLLIPTGFLVIPLSWLVWSALLKLYSPMVTCFSFILISTHGFFSTIFMIYAQIPYREAAIGYVVFTLRFVGIRLKTRERKTPVMEQSLFHLRTSHFL